MKQKYESFLQKRFTCKAFCDVLQNENCQYIKRKINEKKIITIYRFQLIAIDVEKLKLLYQIIWYRDDWH